MQTLTNRNVKYMLKNINCNKRLFIILSIFMGIGLLMTALCLTVAAHCEMTENMESGGTAYVFEGLSVVGFCVFAISIFIYLFISPIQMFSYNLVKHKTDMMYALPIKRFHRFVADFSGGLIVILVPYIVFGFAASVIIFAGLNNITFPSQILSNIGKYIFLIYFLGALAIISAYSSIALVCQFTGTVIDTVIFACLLLSEVPAIVFAISNFIQDNALHIPHDVTLNTSSSFYVTSPLGMIMYAFLKATNCGEDNYILPVWFFVLFSLIIIAATIILACIIQKTKKAEQTGRSITCESVFYVQTAIISIAAIIFGFYISVLLGIIIGIVAVAALYLLVKRGRINLKVIISNTVIFCVTGAVMFSFMRSVSITNSFGYGSKVPSTSLVKSVTVTVVNENVEAYTMEYTDKNDIKKLVEFNKEGINRDETLSDGSEFYENQCTSDETVFSYKLMSGFQKNRDCTFSHIIASNDFYEFIYQSDEYKQALAEAIKDAMSVNASEYYDSYAKKNTYSNSIDFGDGNFYSMKNVELSKDKTEKLESEIYDAALKDYSERTLEEEIENDIYITVNGFTVLRSDKNIIRVLTDNFGSKIIPSEVLENGTVTIIDPDSYYMGATYYTDDYYVNDIYETDILSVNSGGMYSDDYDWIGYVECCYLSDDEFSSSKEEYQSTYGKYISKEYISYIIVSDNADRKDDLTFGMNSSLYQLYRMRENRRVVENTDDYYIMIFTGDLTGENYVLIPKNSETCRLYESL